ncbi:MAG TPA: hypothetical protein VFE55_05885 [Acidimicrobiia bacterium]|nr:hypothetical protein [Acidimicrobiia bacterium]
MGGPATGSDGATPGGAPRRRGPNRAGPNTVLVAFAHGVGRYRFVVAGAAAVLLGLALLPTSRPDQASAGRPGGGGGFTVVDPRPAWKPAPHRARPARTAGSVPATSAAPTYSSAATSTSSGPSATRAATPTTGRMAQTTGPAVLPSPVCDPATGRLAVPSRFAPPCVPSAAANGGTTWPGVTAETITVAVYRNRGDVAARALAAAAGDRDSDEEVAATYRSYADYFERHYQTWGRRVRLAFLTPSGAEDDPVRARADAVRAATELGAFASWGGPPRTSAYADELAARRVLCICAVPEPDSWYQARAPYVISPAPTASERISLQSEYVAKRLAGRTARFAADTMLAAQNRTFGLVYENLPDQAGLRSAESLERELRRAGVELADSVAFAPPGAAPAATGSAEARKVVSRMRLAGATSVLYVGDGLFPVFLTQEATRQGYGPEWVLLGPVDGGGAGAGRLGGVDTTFSGRTYDQTQWAHAFGLSFAGARLAPGEDEAWRIHVWHTGQPPPARATYARIYEAEWMFFTGSHLGGPRLTPAAVRDGLFRLPPAGQGMVTSPSVSFGRHGVWPEAGEDYGAGDDVTEVWWDPAAAGPDEAGGQGVGMYRYVAGGRRWLPGRQPTADTAAFDPAGSVTVYDEPPPSDRPPSYPHRD